MVKTFVIENHQYDAIFVYKGENILFMIQDELARISGNPACHVSEGSPLRLINTMSEVPKLDSEDNTSKYGTITSGARCFGASISQADLKHNQYMMKIQAELS